MQTPPLANCPTKPQLRIIPNDIGGFCVDEESAKKLAHYLLDLEGSCVR